AFAHALRIEDAVIERGAAARERDVGDRELRILDRQRERGARLIAVKRAMAIRAHPAGAKLRPFAIEASLSGLCPGCIAGAVAVIACAARAEVFAAAAEAAVTEAVVGKLDRAVGIAFAGRE